MPIGLSQVLGRARANHVLEFSKISVYYHVRLLHGGVSTCLSTDQMVMD